jgi:hypothetical protein
VSAWTPERHDQLRSLWSPEPDAQAIADALGTSRGAIYREARKLGLPAQSRGRRRLSDNERFDYGGPLKRFESFKPRGHGVDLANDHPAVRFGRTLFTKQVQDQAERPRLLIGGENSRKVGKAVMKGKLKGSPIFTLTLEERATCPRSCLQWNDCYGNNSHWAVRIKHGRAFEERLWDELADKQAAHPHGFLVRLHILGDFYSVDYAELWLEALEAYPALHIFGYTARDPDGEIGGVVRQMLGLWPDRCHIRFSGFDGPTDGSIVVNSADETDHVVCPAQTGKTDCCATCAFCWHSDRTIAFLKH